MNAVASAEDLLTSEHRQWLRSIELYKVELSSLQHQLEDLISDAKIRGTMARIEQFQNKFIRQKEVIDELRHEIKQHENKLEKMNVPDTHIYIEHVGLREEFNRFFDLYIEMRHDFIDFIS